MIKRFHNNESGVTNLVILAIALPLLVAIITGAVDVIRFPVVKQQMKNASQAAANSLGSSSQAFSSINWCAIPGNPDTSCEPCLECTKRNCRCKGLGNSMAESELKQATEILFDELTSSGSGIYSSKPENVFIEGAIFTVYVDTTSTEGRAVKVERIASSNGSLFGATLESSGSLEDYVSQKVLGNKLGVLVNREKKSRASSYHVGIVAFRVAVKVDHVFAFSKRLKFGKTDSSTNRESVIESHIIRPLPSSFSLRKPGT